jgi:ATP-dependent Clp protease protease subunit
MANIEAGLESTIINHLTERRTVLLRGMINQEAANQVISRLLLLQGFSSEPINLLIDSNGGSLGYALRISDVISYVLAAPVKGIVIGDCLSAATLVLLHCTERISTPNASFLIHSGRMFEDLEMRVDQTTHKNIRLLHRDYMKTADRMIQLYAQKLNLSRKKVEKLIKRGDQDYDHVMSPEEALKIGLIQKVLKQKLDLFDSRELEISFDS